MKIFLHLQAPFAAFRRSHETGAYRTSMPVMPYTAAWGLLGLLAGDTDRALQRQALPLHLALGVPPDHVPQLGSLFQQLHHYPVGTSGKELKKLAPGGQKYWIAPVRREVLIGLDLVVGVDGPEAFVRRVLAGLAGEIPVQSVPYAGDNQLFLDRVDVIDDAALSPRVWYTPLASGDRIRPGACRLDVAIAQSPEGATDRTQNSNGSRLVLVAPLLPARPEPPAEAWVETTGRSPAGDQAPPRARRRLGRRG